MTLNELVAKCKASVHVDFNVHTVNYWSVADEISNNHIESIPKEILAEMIEKNQMVSPPWYPDTPSVHVKYSVTH